MTKDELTTCVEEMEEALCYLESKIGSRKTFKKSRKEEVLEVLVNAGRIHVGGIAKALNITSRNVSSYLTYLRRDGIDIATDSKGRKYIEQ